MLQVTHTSDERGERVEIAFDTIEDRGPSRRARLVYGDPQEALRDACRFVEAALVAVRGATR